MSEMPVPAAVCEGLFVIRKPIFDREQGVWGHELDAGASATDMVATTTAITECMAHDGLDMTLGTEVAEQKILVTLTPQMLFEKAFLQMPRDRTVYVLNEDVPADPKTTERVQVFKDLGYSFGITVGGRNQVPQVYVELADLVRVRLTGLQPKEVLALVRKVKPLGKTMIASGVDEWQVYEGTRALGFAFFQGSFFSTPKVEPGKKLAENSLTRVLLLQELMQPGCDLGKLAELISQDTILSYRLLKFINSASFALVKQVESIPQAVALLGLNQLKQWASFMVMAGLDNSRKGEELSYSGLQRARFMQQCSLLIPAVPASSDAMFMVGLFSRLDAQLGLPMREVLANMPIDKRIAAALCGEKNPVREWLDMTDAVDCGDWPLAQAVLATIGLNPRAAAVEYLRASSWAGKHCLEQKQLA